MRESLGTIWIKRFGQPIRFFKQVVSGSLFLTSPPSRQSSPSVFRLPLGIGLAELPRKVTLSCCLLLGSHVPGQVRNVYWNVHRESVLTKQAPFLATSLIPQKSFAKMLQIRRARRPRAEWVSGIRLLPKCARRGNSSWNMPLFMSRSFLWSHGFDWTQAPAPQLLQ